MSEKNEENKKEEIQKIIDLFKSHGQDKIIQGLKIIQELLQKDLQQLELIAKNTDNEAIKKVLKLVMEYKINNL